MANETILMSEVISATPRRIFEAWLDSAEHSALTGSQASVVPAVGGSHTAWDGYVQGRTLELDDGVRIVQSWRTTDFPADSPDSRLEITLEPTLGGTLVTLLHTDIPSGQSDRYRQGWNEFYLSRMKVYFSESLDLADKTEPQGEPLESLAPSPPAQVRAPTRRAAPRKAAGKATRKAAGKATRKAAGKATPKAAGKATRKTKAVARKASSKTPGKIAKNKPKKQPKAATKRPTQKNSRRPRSR